MLRQSCLTVLSKKTSNYTIFGENMLSCFSGPWILPFFVSTEIIAHDHRIDKFKERSVEVVGVSIDSQFTHFAWRETPVDKGGIGRVHFPIVADVKHEITRAYGIEHPVAGVAMRASFLIDKGGIVQHQVVNVHAHRS